MEFLTRYKPEVVRFLLAFFTQKREKLTAVNQWGRDTIEKLQPFVTSGKLLRGSMLLYAYDLFAKEHSQYAVAAASALELFQSGLLIHDDIMDQDPLRRGKPSIYRQYETLIEKKHGRNAQRFGESMGTNAGDLCFFLAYELIGSLPPAHMHVVQIVSREFARVVVAQMQDVSAGHLPTSLTSEEVLGLYRNKTARYSFSLPLGVGALLAGAPESTAQAFEQLGEHMGILFQIRDDELAVTGESRLTGKPVGSDEKNTKQTINTKLSKKELEKRKAVLKKESESAICALSIPETKKQDLRKLVEFCDNRNV